MALPFFQSLTSLFNNDKAKEEIAKIKERELIKNLNIFFTEEKIDAPTFKTEAVPMLDSLYAIAPTKAASYIHDKIVSLTSSSPLSSDYDLLINYYFEKFKNLGDFITPQTKDVVEFILSRKDTNIQKIFFKHFDLGIDKKIGLLGDCLQRKNFTASLSLMENLYNTYVRPPKSSPPSITSSSITNSPAPNSDINPINKSLALMAIILSYSENLIIYQNTGSTPQSQFDFFRNPLSGSQDAYRLYLTCLRELEAIDYNAFATSPNHQCSLTRLFESFEVSSQLNHIRPKLGSNVPPLAKSFMENLTSFKERLKVATLYAHLHNDFERFEKEYLSRLDFEETINALFQRPESAPPRSQREYKNDFYRALLLKCFDNQNISGLIKCFNIIPPKSSAAWAISSLSQAIIKAYTNENIAFLNFIGQRGRPSSEILNNYPALSPASIEVFADFFTRPLPIKVLLAAAKNAPHKLNTFIKEVNFTQKEIDEIVQGAIRAFSEPIYNAVKELPCSAYPYDMISSLFTSSRQEDFNISVLKDILIRENQPEFYLLAHEKGLIIDLRPELLEHLKVLKEKKELSTTFDIIEDYKARSSIKEHGESSKIKNINKI